MLKTRIVLPNGTEIFSGAGTINAIQSITITECVNGAQELTLGSCCANMIEVKIIAPEGRLSVAAGDELIVYREDEAGNSYKIGLFYAEKPTRTSANSISITAYDRISWFDRDLTQWLSQLNEWPYSLEDLASKVCEQCGLTLANEEIPNGSYPVKKFSGDGITGRQLMQWIGQIAGRFCRATADGDVEFAWYTPLTTHDIGVTPYGGSSATFEDGNLSIRLKGMAVFDDGDGNVTVDANLLTVTDDGNGNVVIELPTDVKTIMYYQNGLTFEDYSVAAIEKVQLRQNEEDIGTVYPDGITDAVNTYTITGNPLLVAASGTDLLPIAQNLYELLKNVSYTPCKVAVPANMVIRSGHTVLITDRNGKTITAYVMTKTQSGQRDTIECTGSPARDSSTAINNMTLQALSGKVLNIRTDVDGLKIANEDAAGNYSKLNLEVAGIKGQVGSIETKQTGTESRLTTVEQTAQGLSLSVEKIQTQGAEKVKTGMGYTFDDKGLLIAQEGKQMKNLLDNSGMYVKRGEEVMLQANDKGVVATDVSVRNYLIVGTHARFEDFDTGRTACFWLEG